MFVPQSKQSYFISSSIAQSKSFPVGLEKFLDLVRILITCKDNVFVLCNVFFCYEIIILVFFFLLDLRDYDIYNTRVYCVSYERRYYDTFLYSVYKLIQIFFFFKIMERYIYIYFFSIYTEFLNIYFMLKYTLGIILSRDQVITIPI